MRKPTVETRSIRQAAAPRVTGQTAKPPAPPPPVVKPRSARRRIWVTVLLVLPAVCCTVVLMVISRRPTELCRQWEQEARTAEGRAAEQLVAKLDRYGRHGLPAVVRLLNAESADTVTAACKTLTARLQRLQAGANEQDCADLDIVARELTATFEHLSGKAPRETVDLALLLLSTTGRLGLADQLDDDLRARLFVACDEVLSRAPPALDAPPIPLAALLPSAPIAPPITPFVEDEPRPVAASTTPETIAQSAPEASTPPAQLPAANAAARIETVSPPTDAAVRPASASVTVYSEPMPTEPPAADKLLRADAWTLFEELDGTQGKLAAAELRRRGFSQREIELGRHLTSTDPLERQRFARELPALGVTEAKPWLVRLCRDDDAAVRRIAVAIMATTNDPAIQELLRQLSLDDEDDEVRRTAMRATGRTTGRLQR